MDWVRKKKLNSLKSLLKWKLFCGEHIDTIILELMEFQVTYPKDKTVPPYIIKQEYQTLLDLPQGEKEALVHRVLGV